MLPNSGQITLSQVQTELGGSNPIGLWEYVPVGRGGPCANAGVYNWGEASGNYGLGGLRGRRDGGYEALSGSGSWVVPNSVYGVIRVYIVAGGGGGGAYVGANDGAGGGSGGYYWPAETYAIGEYQAGQTVNWAVGAGGAPGANGGNSNFGNSIVCVGGGGALNDGNTPGGAGAPNGYAGWPSQTPGDSGIGAGRGGAGAPVGGSPEWGQVGFLTFRWVS